MIKMMAVILWMCMMGSINNWSASAKQGAQPVPAAKLKKSYGSVAEFNQASRVPGQYIVVLKENITRSRKEPEGAGSQVSEVAAQLASAFGGRLLNTWDGVLNGFLINISAEKAKRLAKHPWVRTVTQDAMVPGPSANPVCWDGSNFRYFTQDSGFITSPQTINCPSFGDCKDNWGLDRIGQRLLPLNSSASFTYTGLGVHIYILDSGLGNHLDFRTNSGVSRVGNGTNFATADGEAYPNPNDMVDCTGHGTHVAAIAAGRRYGVAKEATIHPVRIGHCNANILKISEIINGINWIAVNHIKPAVVNFSVNITPGLAGNYDEETILVMEQAFRDLINYFGVTVVNSAGNHNASASNFSPSRMDEMIVVAASTITDDRMGTDPNNGPCVNPDTGRTRECGSSNYGSTVDIFAPGEDIISASHKMYNGACRLTGTSMAAPHVTGVIALYLQANPAATPSQVAQAIINNSTAGVVKGNLGPFTPNRLVFKNFF